MRSLCAVLLAATFLVGFTAEIDSPNPYPETEVKNKDDVESICTYTVQMTSDAAVAVDDCEPGGLPNRCCSYWEVTVEWGGMWPSVSCTTGGNFQCKENCGGEEDEVGEVTP